MANSKSDDYWNKSSRKITPFDFDDDADDVTFMKGFRQQLATDESSNDLELVDWDGTSISADVSTVVPFSGSSLSLAGAEFTVGNISPSPSVSISVPSSSFSSIADAVKAGDRLRQHSTTSPSVESKRHLLTPVQSARALVMGRGEKGVPLEHHRSLRDKRALLAETVRLGDTDSIVTVLLFMRRTLKRALFESELRRCQCAHAAFVTHLRSCGESDAAADTLAMLCRSEDVAMLHYGAIVTNVASIDEKLRALKHCWRTHLSQETQLSFYSHLVQQQINLIERQRPVESARPDVNGPPLTGTSVLTTLYYCCLNHYNKGSNHLGSPEAVRSAHSLSDVQYLWTALRARASVRAWPDVQQILSPRKWFGVDKGPFSTNQALERAAEILHRKGAPEEILSQCLSRIDNADRRIKLAKTYRCHRLVIDTLASQKNRRALHEYTNTLTASSTELAYANKVLLSSNIKWRN